MVNKNFLKAAAVIAIAVLTFYAGHFVKGLVGTPLAELNEGKNIFTLENYSANLYASMIIGINKDVEVIVYRDFVTGHNLSYVNAFGGVGMNFQLREGEMYEIYTRKSVILRAP